MFITRGHWECHFHNIISTHFRMRNSSDPNDEPESEWFKVRIRANLRTGFGFILFSASSRRLFISEVQTRWLKAASWICVETEMLNGQNWVRRKYALRNILNVETLKRWRAPVMTLEQNISIRNCLRSPCGIESDAIRRSIESIIHMRCHHHRRERRRKHRKVVVRVSLAVLCRQLIVSLWLDARRQLPFSVFILYHNQIIIAPSQFFYLFPSVVRSSSFRKSIGRPLRGVRDREMWDDPALCTYLFISKTF